MRNAFAALVLLGVAAGTSTLADDGAGDKKYPSLAVGSVPFDELGKEVLLAGQTT